MTKAEIATEIAKSTDMDKAEVLKVIEGFMSIVKSTVAHGESVFLKDFGRFIVKKRARKIARNISQNTAMVVPEHNIPYFKPADSFKDRFAK